MNFASLKEDLLSVAEEASRVAEKKRISEYEIFVSSYSNSQVTIQGGMVNASDGVSEGMGIRVALGGKIGFASATGIGSDSVRFATEEALSVARTLDKEDRRFCGFASPKRGGKEGITDKKMLGLTGERLVSETSQIFSCATEYDRRVVSVRADVTLNYGGYAVANSNGIERVTRSIACGGSAEVTALDGARRKSGFDFIVERRNPDFSGLGERASRNAVDMLSSEPLNASEKMTTIWEPLTAAQFVDTAFSSSVNGRSVVEGRSAFAGKIGAEVGIEGLTVIDAGQMPESVATTSIDSEGIPRRNTKIIENGILKGFLFDTYYAKIYGTESTGNASRGSFTNPPAVSTTTIEIKTGERKKEDIIAKTRRGILVTGIVMGMGHSNLISGDFSVVAPNPFLIEGGRVRHALEPVTIAGNLYESLRHLTEIGGDPLLTPFAYTPTLAFEGFTVSG